MQKKDIILLVTLGTAVVSLISTPEFGVEGLAISGLSDMGRLTGKWEPSMGLMSDRRISYEGICGPLKPLRYRTFECMEPKPPMASQLERRVIGQALTG